MEACHIEVLEILTFFLLTFTSMEELAVNDMYLEFCNVFFNLEWYMNLKELSYFTHSLGLKLEIVKQWPCLLGLT